MTSRQRRGARRVLAPDLRFVLDAGAFIGYERGDERLRGLLEIALQPGRGTTSSAVVAQVWSGDARQARLARLLSADGIDERPLDADAARRIGAQLRVHGTSDVVDGHVANLATDAEARSPGRVRVLTSDPDDLIALGVDPASIVTI